ncbi:vanadium-dependent haloperoxidase [soil metagenome]
MRSARGIVAGVLATGLLALTPTQTATAHRPPPADPSVIAQWNQIGVATIAADNVAVPPAAPRKQSIEVYLYLAFMHAAMYNAVVGIEGGYRPYHFDARPPRHASSQAAAVAAAHRVLVTYSPEQQATLDAAYATSLAAIPDGKAKTRGMAYGELAATTMVAQRAHDGRNAPILFTQPPAPGTWRPTPPTLVPFSAPWLGYVAPLALRSSDQFDPGPAPALTSRRYTRDFLEVKSLGQLDSTTRTEAMTETARFYAGNPVVQFTLGLVDQAQTRHLDLVESARLFAAVHVSLADASIAVWWTKHHYGVWRPISAVRLADTDGNPATTADPAWDPSVIPTPPYPDYVSAYNGVMGAYTRALQDTLGTCHLALTLTSTMFPAPDPRHTRFYDTGGEARQQVIDARVWLGLHFRFADRAGARMGQQVAHYTLDHNFQAVDDHHGHHGR